MLDKTAGSGHVSRAQIRIDTQAEFFLQLSGQRRCA
jgi:hypothetical protein